MQFCRSDCRPCCGRCRWCRCIPVSATQIVSLMERYALYWVPFLVKSDYLCLRYGDKRIIFKADADATIVVAGHFFSSCGLCQCFLVTLDEIKRTQSERKTVRLRMVAGQSCLRVLEKCWDSMWSLVEDIWSICGNWKKVIAFDLNAISARQIFDKVKKIKLSR